MVLPVSPGQLVPEEDIPRGPAGNEVPPEDIPVDYNSASQMAKTAIEQGLAGATLGLSKVAETKLLGVRPEDIEGREKANPITATGANILGTAGMIAGTGGLGGLARGAGVGARIGIGALEGGGIGGLNQITDDWSQDKALDAQKIAASIGIGSLIGGAGAGIVEGVRAKFSPKAAASAAEIKPGAASEFGSVEAAPPAGVVDAPVGVKGVQPTSYQDIIKARKDAQFSGNAIERPEAGVLEDALSRVEMNTPVNPLQRDSLKNQNVRDTYNTFKETPGEIGEALQQHEAAQKNELVAKTLKTIRDISPGSEPLEDAVQGGKTAIEAFTNQYQNEQAALKPIFDNLKGLPYEGDLMVDTVSKMAKAVPRVADAFDYAGGELSLRPYKTSMGIDEATYKAVKQAVEALQDEKAPDSFRKLWDIRKGLDQNIDIMTRGQGSSEIGALKKGLMDLMQESSGNPEIRDAFKRYAINQQQREVIEKAFGASVGSHEFGAISKVKPEMIGDKIFGNTATTEAAKNILPKDQFNVVLANWISEAKAAATDKGAFSSNKFGSFLRRNQDALKVAFSDNPEALQRLQDLTTIMRILPDSSPVNPSGTAKTLVRMISGMKLHDMTWEGLLASVPQKAVKAIEKNMQLSELNKALAGQAEKNVASEALKKQSEKMSGKIDKGVKSLFSGASAISRRLH